MTAGGPHRLALVADAHFHDATVDFGGAGLLVDGQRLALRPWAQTAHAIRAVNESAAALTAALTRIAAAGIRHVILAGDYTDDGQAGTLHRLSALLHHWQDAHGLRFHAIPGNHDVYAAHGKHGSAHVATGPGQQVLVTSDPAQARAEGGIATPAMRCLGMPAGLLPMASFGLFRQPDHLHWESPFGGSDDPARRMYDATAADGSVTHRLMDASYLVEPEPGLWLLMIDVNVFEPRPGRTDPTRKRTFHDPSVAGWDALLRTRPYLLGWIADVVARAAAADRTLVTVSHYPVLDPFLPQGGAEAALTPHSTLSRRTPSPAVGDALRAAGLRWHAGGHLHINRVTRDRGLTDLSLPSPVSFPPAVTLLTATPGHIDAETLSLADLPPDPALTGFYAAEGRDGPGLAHGDFLAAQFRARVARVRVPRDWPASLEKWIGGRTVADLCARLDMALPDADGARSLSDLPLIDLIADAYLLRDGGALAPAHVPAHRLSLYRALSQYAVLSQTAAPVATDIRFLRRFLTLLRPDTAPDRP